MYIRSKNRKGQQHDSTSACDRGASGIGREIARTFAATGAKVFVSDINANGLEALSSEVEGVMTGVCDNWKRSDVAALIPAAVEALGGLDVLVNNAGISGPTAPVAEVDPDEWKAVMNVNLNGTFNLTRLAIPHLKKSPPGTSSSSPPWAVGLAIQIEVPTVQVNGG